MKRKRFTEEQIIAVLREHEAVGAEIVRLLQPLGVEAAIQAIAQREHRSGEKQRQIELALEQARYEATRARRQYDTVDPENRLIAHELKRRWNGALATVRALEEELEALVRQRPAALSAEERHRLLQMGVDLEPRGIIRRPLPSRVSASSGSCCARSWHTSRVTRFICCCIGTATIIPT
ncbi:hypothetical protein NKH61_34575 [Mesorhizobium sp. M1005]|uniref:hypothetical protein n=1 Tax=unclassified Mesorhizobium TaxID=325217 RepID=UPI003339C645